MLRIKRTLCLQSNGPLEERNYCGICKLSRQLRRFATNVNKWESKGKGRAGRMSGYKGKLGISTKRDLSHGKALETPRHPRGLPRIIWGPFLSETAVRQSPPTALLVGSKETLISSFRRNDHIFPSLELSVLLF